MALQPRWSSRSCSDTCTLTVPQQQRLDVTYTNLLRRVQNIHWTEHPTRERIYGKNSHLYLKGLPSVAYNSPVIASVPRARLSRPSFCGNPTVQSTLGNWPSQIPSLGTQGSRGRTSQTPWQTDWSGARSFLAPRPEGSNDDNDERHRGNMLGIIKGKKCNLNPFL